jgi:hypothetical protein
MDIMTLVAKMVKHSFDGAGTTAETPGGFFK